MVAHIKTVAFEGIDVTPVDVQVQIGPGLPAFTVVGLPDKAVAESRERVRAALNSIGLALPAKKIIVNLAPADLAKEGSHFDLPIALGVLVAMGVVPSDAVQNYVALGELSLDGSLLPVAGVLPAALMAVSANAGIICPEASGAEAVWAGETLEVLAASSLLAYINHVKGRQILNPPAMPNPQQVPKSQNYMPDLREVKGQATARRALEVAAAGGHNLLMIGPPGSGKSLLASCLPSILPAMQAKEMLESSIIASVSGMLQEGRLTTTRPYRDPHHSSSMAAIVGGGRKALPGEISLAHCGVLFMDEFPEFPRGVLESLRQPLETGKVTIARAQAHVTYPADFQLIAAMKPVRSGYWDDAGRACNKAPRCAVYYHSKISGPLLDRIDIHIEVPAVDTLSMLADGGGESSAEVAPRVQRAQERQAERYVKLGLENRLNASVRGEVLAEIAPLEPDAKTMLEEATRQMQLSMRGYTRVLRVARTIADMAANDTIQKGHIAEAITYRQLSFGR
ncbi:MAG: YifB family Mg chelatase-like AAA ATPase [Alphaproteobacteria bacterium]|nr:YifB family Mg chelatase-like AAA ATPase [Alphaproteobacteria bacterium]